MRPTPDRDDRASGWPPSCSFSAWASCSCGASATAGRVHRCRPDAANAAERERQGIAELISGLPHHLRGHLRAAHHRGDGRDGARTSRSLVAQPEPEAAVRRPLPGRAASGQPAEPRRLRAAQRRRHPALLPDGSTSEISVPEPVRSRGDIRPVDHHDMGEVKEITRAGANEPVQLRDASAVLSASAL